MKYLTGILLIALLPVGEIHSWFDRYDVPNVNWIYAKEVPMWLTWAIKYAEGQLQWLMVAAAMLSYRRNRFNRSAIVLFATYCVLDTIAYFYNYRGHGYESVYVGCALAFLISFYGLKHEKGNYIRSTG